MNKYALLNDFAIRSFRDVADYDYICARMAAKTTLIPQFLWLGLQALEKYLKWILLLNRIPAKHVRHDLSLGLKLIRKHLPFEIRLSKSSEDLISHLDTYGRFRYLETPFYVFGYELCQLDKTIWEIRRYCRTLNYSITLHDGSPTNMLSNELMLIETSEMKPPQHFRISGGFIEKILDDKKHPARKPLVWQNLYFGGRSRRTVRLARFFQSTNSPLSLHPEILDDVQQYVYLPKEIVEIYRNYVP